MGFWAPLGASVPEPCPTGTGFYCPGGGSRPITLPAGQSMATREVPALTKAMTLGLSMDDFAAQREQIRTTLAVQYGVDPSLVTLTAQPGSVQLTVTIATAGTAADGTAVSADLSALEQTVGAVDDAALASAISAVVGTSIPLVSQPAQAATVTQAVLTGAPAPPPSPPPQMTLLEGQEQTCKPGLHAVGAGICIPCAHVIPTRAPGQTLPTVLVRILCWQLPHWPLLRGRRGGRLQVGHVAQRDGWRE